jgi:hypothetical protein
MQYRGFGALHSRLLLAQQCDIEVLEQELNTLDVWDANTQGLEIKLQSKARDDQECTMEDMVADDFPFDRTRPEVLAELRQQLMEYGECDEILRYSPILVDIF